MLWLALFALAAPAAAQTFPPNNGSPVVDQAGILTPAQVARPHSQGARRCTPAPAAQFAVATVKSLEGYPIDDYAYRLGRAWKLGTAKNNDEASCCWSRPTSTRSDRDRLRRRRFMTDAMSGLIIREAILPHFKQNPPDYGGGIEAGADAIIKQMSLSARRGAEECRRSPASAAAAAAFRRQARCRCSSG